MATNMWSGAQESFKNGISLTPTVKTPSSTGAYTTNVNTALKSKGIPPEHIQYNPANNAYSVGGEHFMTAHRNYGGTGYTSPNHFATAYNQYNQKQSQGTGSPNTAAANVMGGVVGNTVANQVKAQVGTTPTASPTYNPYAASSSNMNPYNTQVNDAITQLWQQANNPQAIDPYSSPEYAAAAAQAARNGQASTRAAQEAYGSAGFGRSLGLGERVAGIQNENNNYVLTQVVPNIIAAKQAQQQQQFTNAMNTLNYLQTQQTRSDNQVQQDWTNNYNKSSLTGTYLPPGAEKVISDLIGLKQQAETKGITAEQRAGLSTQADNLRAQLQGMGLDPTQFGSGVTAAQAGQNMGNVGQRTLSGQAQDTNNKQVNWGMAQDVQNQTGMLVSPQDDPNGYWRQLSTGTTAAGTPLQDTYNSRRAAITDQQWQDTFDQNNNQWQQTFDQNQANNDDASAYRWAGLDHDMAAELDTGAKYEGMTVNQVIDNVRANLADVETKKIPPEAMDSAYLQIIGAGLPEAQENQALAAIGLTQPQIKALDSKYLTGGGTGAGK